MGYLSDFREAEEHAERVRAAHPNCDGTATCTGGWDDDGHTVDCRWWRSHMRRIGRRIADDAMEAKMLHLDAVLSEFERSNPRGSK